MFKTWCGRVFFLCEKLPKGDTHADFWWRISFEEKEVAKFLPFNFFWQQVCVVLQTEKTLQA